MRSVYWAKPSLLLTGVLLAVCVAGGKPLPGLDAPDPLDVSLLQLIATPKEYSGKVVRVIGFCHLEFEGNGLYVHREDFQQAIYKNAIWLDVDHQKQTLSDHYVLLEGTFDASQQGHMGLFSGYLTNVTRMERWPGRAGLAERIR